MVTMNDEQKYSAVLKELGEVLQDKNTTITCQRWQIDQLKEKLKAAEAERDETQQECVEAEAHLVDAETSIAEVTARLRRINVALRKCVNVEARAVIDFDGLFDLQADIQAAVQQLEHGGAA